jgi:hypothetical protein
MLGALFGLFSKSFAKLNFEQITLFRLIPWHQLMKFKTIPWSVLVRMNGFTKENISAEDHSEAAAGTITLTMQSWGQIQERLNRVPPVPSHVSFALDAAYFCRSDPIRAIIMACAAWETALRTYLANIASKADPKYLARSRENKGIPCLWSYAKRAKGKKLFHDLEQDPYWSERAKRQRQCIDQLPNWRNKLLHQGELSIPKGAAEQAAVAVLDAIDWLFS